MTRQFPAYYNIPYEEHRLDRSDTGETPDLVYYIVEGTDYSKPYHIILSGSGHESVSPEFLRYQSQPKQALFRALYQEGAPLVLIEKAGVTEGDYEPAHYHGYNTIDQRAWDVAEVIEDLAICHSMKSYVLIGASEGAEVALRSLALQSEANRTKLRGIVLMAWGSDQAYDELVTSYLLQKKVPALLRTLIRPYLHTYVQKQFKKIAEHPTDHNRLFLGNSYPYWASFMRMANIREVCRNLKVPICFVHGADDLIIAQSDALLRDLQLNTTEDIPFSKKRSSHHQAAEGHKITWLRYANATHRLDIKEVAVDIVRWLRNIQRPA